jgi:predicted nucleotidyltransferase
MTSVAELLTEHQHAVADRFLTREETERRHLVVSLSGAHAYGFPSPDSDLDLKAIHIEDAGRLLALSYLPKPAERLEVVEGVELDYSSNELRDVLLGILKGNGNYLERVLGPLRLRESPELAELRPLVQRSLSRLLHRHYRGFASGQLQEWEKTGRRSAKKLLYVLRTALTGTHALRAGEIVIDLNRHLDEYGFSAARELIEQKRAGEQAELPDAMAERWRGEVNRAFALLDQAREASPLPEEAPNAAELDGWLVAVRLRSFGR